MAANNETQGRFGDFEQFDRTAFDAETLSDGEGLEGREESAHTENMLVVPEYDEYGYVFDGDPTYTLYSASGSEYDVDPRGECGCPDMIFNSPEDGCKHQQRVVAELNDGRVPVPDAPVDEWFTTAFVERAEAAAEQAAELRANDDANKSEVDAAEAIVDGFQTAFEAFRERVGDNVAPLAEHVDAPLPDESEE
jgi:hypothetical protein